MAKRRKFGQQFLKARSTKPKHNWSNEGTDRRRLLDMGREKYFRFDLGDILEASANEDNRSIIHATVVNKAGQLGIEEANDYLGRLVDEGSLEKEIAERISKLLRRYSKFR